MVQTGILKITVPLTALRLAEKKGKPRAELRGCEACPMAHNCALNSANKKEEVAE